jgi:dienelactone hydrolase
MAGPPTYETIGADERDGARILDVRIAADESPIEAYLVEPEAPGPDHGPGLLFAHWFEPQAPNGDRSEYLDEAVSWARERGATSILPQLLFPWHGEPAGSAVDVARIREEVARLQRCLDTLVAQPHVDAARLGVVGHDFGAMHGLLLASEDGRPAAYVFIAGVPRWGDWFLPFWTLPDDRIDYLLALRPLDPIEHLERVAPARLLFQFGDRDWFIAQMTGFEFRRAAGDTAEVTSYDAGHDMSSPEALADRTTFLAEALGIPPSDPS